MKVVAAYCVATAWLLTFAAGQQPTASVSEVHRLYTEDQADRGVGGKALPSEQVELRDRERRIRVHAMLESGKLKTAEDFHDAAFVYQHGHDPEEYLLAHVLATVAVQKGDAKSLWISAATLDRYLQAIGQPQIFGTQYSNRGEGPFTQAPYNRDLMPDDLRAVFCVPNLDQQRENIKAFNVGQYPERMIPPGCTR